MLQVVFFDTRNQPVRVSVFADDPREAVEFAIQHAENDDYLSDTMSDFDPIITFAVNSYIEPACGKGVAEVGEFGTGVWDRRWLPKVHWDIGDIDDPDAFEGGIKALERYAKGRIG